MAEDIWVQCDDPKCKKWRKLPTGSKAPPDNVKWYCRMNPDPLRNACSIPEEHYSDDEWDQAADQPKEVPSKHQQGSKRRKSGQGYGAYGSGHKRARVHMPAIPQQLPKFFASQAEERQHLETALQRIQDNCGTWAAHPPADIARQPSHLRLQLALPLWVWNGLHALAPDAARVAAQAVDLITAATSTIGGTPAAAQGLPQQQPAQEATVREQHPHPQPHPQHEEQLALVQQRFTFASLSLLVAASAALDTLRQGGSAHPRRSSGAAAEQSKQGHHHHQQQQLGVQPGGAAAAVTAAGASGPQQQEQEQQGERFNPPAAAVAAGGAGPLMRSSDQGWGSTDQQAPSSGLQYNHPQQHIPPADRQQHQQQGTASAGVLDRQQQQQQQQQPLSRSNSLGQHAAVVSAGAPPLSQLLKAHHQQQQQQRGPGQGHALGQGPSAAAAAAVAGDGQQQRPYHEQLAVHGPPANGGADLQYQPHQLPLAGPAGKGCNVPGPAAVGPGDGVQEDGVQPHALGPAAVAAAEGIKHGTTNGVVPAAK